MRRSLLGFTVLAVAALLLPVVSASGANSHADYRAVCPGRVAGTAHCHELVVTDAHGNPLARHAPTGLGPATIDSVYGFSIDNSSSGAGETIAIVDAYDDPNAASDLSAFSTQYNLPQLSTYTNSSTPSPWFRKVNQTGGTSYPRANAGWALEISLDVQWAHAIAPAANILLVEASSNSFSNLMAAESYAGKNAAYVSNSWGGSEFSGESSYDSHFSRTGVSYFVAAGDSGGSAAEYPSASPNVTSVGGTTLNFDSSGNFTSETGWSSGGGGCSAYEQATSAQSSYPTYDQVHCGGMRATPDVSLDADPNSGVSVYDSVKYYGQTGWFTVGGTSASTPMWAARSADTGGPVDASTVYGSAIPFRDITSGDNGNPCLSGYDLCTGRGSWNDGGGGVSATVPGTPVLSAAAGDASVTLSWATPSDGGSAITGYDVYFGTSSGGETLYETGVAGNSITYTGLTNSATYYYEVTAVNALGQSSRSNEVSATPQAGSTASAPTAPQSLAASMAKGKGIQLSWSAPLSDGGSAITGYNVYRADNGTSFSEIATSTSTSYKDAHTTRGVTYSYEVKAVNAVGVSPPSNVASAQAK